MYSGYKPVLTARPLPQCGGLPAGRREDPGRGIRPHRGQGGQCTTIIHHGIKQTIVYLLSIPKTTKFYSPPVLVYMRNSVSVESYDASCFSHLCVSRKVM